MGKIKDRVDQCVAYIRSKTDFMPKTAVVLGSGLGGFGEKIKLELSIPYGEIPGFPVSTVPGHNGRFLLGYVGEEPVICMQGRVHYYEGYSMEDVVLPIRVMKSLGAKRLLLTNAAGGINTDFSSGCLMLITDQITSFVPSPLIGPNEDDFGTRFPDMSQVYNKELRQIAKDTAKELGVDLKEGVYVQATGPSYETPAEIRMFRTLGADAVGMSTTCEAMVANHMGMDILGISCITNMAAGLSAAPLSHEEVKEVADRVGGQFQQLLEAIIRKF